MESVCRLLAALAPTAWGVAWCAYLAVFLREDPAETRLAPRLAWTAATLHAAAIAAPGLAGVCPMLTPTATISGLGLAIGVLHLLLESRARNRAIGVFPLGVALLFALGATAGDPLRRPSTQLPAGSTALHATTAILAYAGLFLAALFGTLYLVQRGALKHRRFGILWERLPSLELLDSFSRRSLLAGAVFLTLTICVGHVVRAATGSTQTYWDAKILATDLIWLACVLVVGLRLLGRIRPAASAMSALVLFALALSNLLVVDIFSNVHRGV